MKQDRDQTPGRDIPAPMRVTPETLPGLSRGLPWAVRMGLNAMTRLQQGSLTVRFPDGRAFHFDAPDPGPDAQLILHNWRLARRVLLGGDIGVAESYMDGDWDSPDITAFLSLFVVNDQLGDDMAMPSWINNAVGRLQHWFNDNTLRGSRRNIAAHYDLGNQFYSRWLDSSMTYSSAIFEDGANSLAAAQTAKYRSLADRTAIGENDHVLEIGCGWGGFAEFAAKERGCRVTGLTISREQHDYACRRIQQEGLGEKVEIKLQDYRQETGTYDCIASIEMFEAVGEKYWPAYFDRIRACLKRGGNAGLQIITIADRFFDYYRRHPDFIQRYIFPGGMLPSPSALAHVTEDAGLRQISQRVFAEDYARTLAHWRERFLDAWQDIVPLGFDERFRRMWVFYLHYCEAGFLGGSIDVRQLVYQRN